MSGASDKAKVWGRRPYAGKSARELLNDISQHINRTRPDDVDDPDDPSLSDLLRYAGPALDRRVGVDQQDDPKAQTLTRLMKHGLGFQEAVVWYWFRHCRYDITEIHFAMNGTNTGGDPEQRRNATRNILRVLASAAQKLPDASSDDVPSMVDDRMRHDRTADDIEADT
jgi:hypothetical protein